MERTKKVLRIIAYGFLIMLGLAIVVPLFLNIEPYSGVPAQTLATDQSNFITLPFEGTDGIDIHYVMQEAGSSTGDVTFLLLHGSLFNAFTWDSLTDELSSYGDVVAYDQIPYGLSEKLIPGDRSGPNPYTTQAQVEQLLSFVDTLDLDTIVLVANSYGATLAVEAMDAQPERFQAAVFLAPAIYVQENMPQWLLNLPQVKKLGPLFARYLGSSRSFYTSTYSDAEKVTEERLARTFIGTQVDAWDLALREYLRVWSTRDLSTTIAELSQPILIVMGEDDAIIPLADAEQAHAMIKQSQLSLLAGCGHVSQEECPEETLAAISTWREELKNKDN